MNYSFFTNKLNLDTNSKIIKFNTIDNKLKLKLLKEILIILKNIKNLKNILIVGIGNDNYISDSIGPKALKNIKVNYYNSKIKVSSLEPGTFKETGISTLKIIKSIVNLLKPDLVILIDSFITDDINNLNKSIIINNTGITSGMGIININDSIDNKYLNTNVITIGVPTALELKLNNNAIPYILSTKDVDLYIKKITLLISDLINKIIYEIL